MMKRILAFLLAAVLTVVFTACTIPSVTPSNVTEKVTLIMTNGKGEIATQFTQAAKDFMADHPDILVEAYSVAVGDPVNIFDKLTSAGQVITLAMMEPNNVVDRYKDFGMDLSGEMWNEHTVYGYKNAEGVLVGFPFAIEGFGLVYNTKVMEKAVGGSFDPFSINTRDKFIALLDKIQASGVQYPIAYQTEAWSVSNHYSSQFLNQTKDPDALIKQLMDGKVDLISNAVWNGYYDTMDVLVSPKYNKYGERPLGQYYDDSHLSVGKGECALLFNGNWAFDSLQAVSGDLFGFMPVPVDNNPDNPLNNKIVAGPTQLFVINKDATQKQQEAAKRFLNWLVYSEKGQDFVVNQSQIISAFRNNPFKVTNPLGASIAEAIQNDRTLPFSTNYVNAADYMNILGPEVQKYIDKKITRADLAKAFENYYKGKK